MERRLTVMSGVKSRPRSTMEPATGPIQIVVTPGSGDGQATAIALELISALTARHYRARLDSFDGLSSLKGWVETRPTRPAALICVGGDGTQSVTAEAAVRWSVPFITVSCGFGNLFARAFRAPADVPDVLDLLTRGQIIRSDVGLRNDELFLCEQSYGLIADVQDDVEFRGVRPRARWQRWLAYYQAALRHLSGAPAAYQVAVDDQVLASDATLVVVANVEAYGPWLPLTPDASPVDGLFDVFVLRGASHRRVFTSLLRRHLRLPGSDAAALVARGQQVTVTDGQGRVDQLRTVAQGLPLVVSPETAAALGTDVPTTPAAAHLVPARAA